MEHTFDSYPAFRAEPTAITFSRQSDNIYLGVLKALNGDAGHRLEVFERGDVWLFVGDYFPYRLPLALGQLVSQAL